MPKRINRDVSEMVDDQDFANEAEQEFESQVEAQAPKRGGNLMKIIVTIIVILVVVIGGWYVLSLFTGISFPGQNSGAVQGASDDWQAVFLDNGQVYFGQIKSTNDRELVLTNIYYLQVINKPLQMTADGSEATDQQTQQELTLVKLGNELHGPTDEMVINRDRVLLTEKLKDDSPVVKGIMDYISNQE